MTSPTSQSALSGQVSVPVAGRVTIAMETIASPLSTSVNPQSSLADVHVLKATSSVTVAEPPLVVGRSLTF